MTLNRLLNALLVVLFVALNLVFVVAAVAGLDPKPNVSVVVDVDLAVLGYWSASGQPPTGRRPGLGGR